MDPSDTNGPEITKDRITFSVDVRTEAIFPSANLYIHEYLSFANGTEETIILRILENTNTNTSEVFLNLVDFDGEDHDVVYEAENLIDLINGSEIDAETAEAVKDLLTIGIQGLSGRQLDERVGGTREGLSDYFKRISFPTDRFQEIIEEAIEKLDSYINSAER